MLSATSSVPIVIVNSKPRSARPRKSKGNYIEIVTIVNRSSKIVNGKWDGKPYSIPAKGKVGLPVMVAEAIKRQNAVMGSEDPYSGEMEYLVGIEEQGDDLSPIEQTQSITRMNRKPLGKNEEVIKGDNGLYSVRQLAGPPAGAGNVAVNTVGTFSKD